MSHITRDFSTASKHLMHTDLLHSYCSRQLLLCCMSLPTLHGANSPCAMVAHQPHSPQGSLEGAMSAMHVMKSGGMLTTFKRAAYTPQVRHYNC